jgi:hypothetical protein
MTMHEGKRAIGKKPSPCDGCPSAKGCASTYIACSAFEAYLDDKPARFWRDAPREPMRVIAKRMITKWHGAEAAEKLIPK